MKQSKTQSVPKQVQPLQGFYSLAEAATLAKCSTQTIARAIKAGKLKAIQPGGFNTTRLIPQGNLVEYLYGNGEAK